MSLVFSLLVISSALGLFTYVIGALIYALPLPLRGVKRWAPLLISDGILVFTLSTSFSILLWLMNYVYVVMGNSREAMVSEILSIAKSISRLYIVLSLVKKMISLLSSTYVLGKGIGSVIGVLFALLGLTWPFQSIILQPMMDLVLGMLRLGVYLWTSIYILAKFGELLTPLMMAIGLIMIAIPFRIGRLAGANLIGFAISAYVVSPLIVPLVKLVAVYNPYLYAYWNSFINLKGISPDVVFPYGKVMDREGKPLNDVAIAFCDLDHVCGTYPIDDKGRYTTVVELGGVPYPISIAVVNIYGVKSNPKEINFKYFNIKPSDIFEMNIKFDDVQKIQNSIYLVVKRGTVSVKASKFVEAEGYMKAAIRLVGNGYAYISIYGIFDPSTFSVTASREFTNVTLERTTWNGGNVFHIGFYLRGEGDIVLIAKIKIENKPQLTPLGYVAAKLGAIAKTLPRPPSPDDPFVLPLLVTVLPAIHLAMIVLIGRGIASLISGTSKTIIAKVW